MKRVWTLALNDLRLTVRDRPALVWLLIFPLLMMWFLSGAGGGEGAEATRLGVLDRDGGEAAARMINMLECDALTAERMKQAADAPLLLTIPEGFSRALADNRPQQLELRVAADTRADLALTARIETQRAISQLLGQAGRGGEDLPRLPARLSISHAGSGRPVPAGAAQSVPGMLTFMVLMMTSIYGAAYLTIEKRTGMLRRQALRMSHGRILLGKLIGRLLVGGLQTTLLVVGGSLLFGIRWGNSIAAFLILMLAFLVCVAAYSTWLGAILRSPAEASALGWILSMVLAALGGCWWPAEAMPDWIVHLGVLLPTTWAMRGFHSLISFGGGVATILLPALALMLFAALFTWLGARRLKLTA